MRDNPLWHWLLHFATPMVMDDHRIKRGDVVTARQLASTLREVVTEVTEQESLEVAIEAIEQLIEQGDDSCNKCGHAAKAAKVMPEPQSKAEVRDRIWQVLVAHPDGLTRGELAQKSDTDEKTVCWAIRDWVKAGLCMNTGNVQKTEAGRRANVIKAVV